MDLPNRKLAKILMSAAHLPQQNRLLRALPSETRARLFPQLELVEMPLGRVLYDADDPLSDVHFPTDAIIAPLHVARDHATVQIAVVGNEGMTGLALLVGGQTAPTQAVVQCPGYAFRLSAQALQREYARHGFLHALLLRYAQALIAQMTQTLVCHLQHSLEQRLCRWLLLTLDRVPSNHLPIRQEVIEKVMGAPGQRVNETLHAFDSLGAIQRNPQQLTVRDRRKLELASCDCYSVVRDGVGRARPQKMERLIDAFPVLASALVNGLSAANHQDFIRQLQGALVGGVTIDLEADAGNIALVAAVSPRRAVKRNIFAAAHGRRIPIECQYWVNLDTDSYGKITAIEILHPPKPLRDRMTARAGR